MEIEHSKTPYVVAPRNGMGMQNVNCSFIEMSRESGSGPAFDAFPFDYFFFWMKFPFDY